jgi:hypothetical protein
MPSHSRRCGFERLPVLPELCRLHGGGMHVSPTHFCPPSRVLCEYEYEYECECMRVQEQVHDCLPIVRAAPDRIRKQSTNARAGSQLLLYPRPHPTARWSARFEPNRTEPNRARPS